MNGNVPVLKYGSQKILDFRISKESTKPRIRKQTMKIDLDL